MSSKLLLCVGGPLHGQFRDVDMNAPALYADETEFDPGPAGGKVKYSTYDFKRIGCEQDRWIEDVLVHESVNLDQFGEASLIDIIMRSWRERHRRGMT